MRKFTILGHDQAGFVPTMMESLLEGGKSTLIDVKFELNPLDGACDQRVHISTRPLQIVYDSNTINELIKIFKLPKDSYLAE